MFYTFHIILFSKNFRIVRYSHWGSEFVNYADEDEIFKIKITEHFITFSNTNWYFTFDRLNTLLQFTDRTKLFASA